MTEQTELDKKIFDMKCSFQKNIFIFGNELNNEDRIKDAILTRYRIICIKQLQIKSENKLSEECYKEIVDYYHDIVSSEYIDVELFTEMIKQTNTILEKYGKNNIMTDIVKKTDDMAAAIAATTTTTTTEKINTDDDDMELID
jgi:hypothetical protein